MKSNCPLPDSFFPLTFKSVGRKLGYKVEVFEGRLVIIEPMWHKALSTNSLFCQALVANGILSERQMQRAARRYRLGATRQGGVIFWQIDQHEEIYDGKVMYYLPDCHRDKAHKPDWVGSILSRRHHWGKMSSRHCFFGLHLLCHTDLTDHTDYLCPAETICVVEAEKTAVILSEIYPQYLWLASGGLTQLQLDKFRPLRGHHLILYPDTDETGETYKSWYETAQLVQQQPFWEDSPPIEVNPILEFQASPDQKSRKIDLVDFILDK